MPYFLLVDNHISQEKGNIGMVGFDTVIVRKCEDESGGREGRNGVEKQGAETGLNCYGRTAMQTFLETFPLAKEKMLQDTSPAA